MNKTTLIFRASIAAASLATTAMANDWTMSLTCDNQFTLYFGTPTATNFTAGGGNSWPTTYTFNATGRANSDYIYVATASDQSTAQGLIGQFTNTTLNRTSLTGDSEWEVFPAGRYLAQLGIGTNPWPAGLLPTTAQVDAAIAYAQANSLWIPTSTAPGNNLNGVGPWGLRPGISAQAQWIWHAAPGGPTDPLRGSFNHEEFLVFRLAGAVPTPGALALLGLAVIPATRRKR